MWKEDTLKETILIFWTLFYVNIKEELIVHVLKLLMTLQTVPRQWSAVAVETLGETVFRDSRNNKNYREQPTATGNKPQ